MGDDKMIEAAKEFIQARGFPGAYAWSKADAQDAYEGLATFAQEQVAEVRETMETDSLTFGERVKLARTRKGLRQSDLGLSKAFISDVENGKRDMSGKHIVQISKVLDVTPNWLLLGLKKRLSDAQAVIDTFNSHTFHCQMCGARMKAVTGELIQ